MKVFNKNKITGICCALMACAGNTFATAKQSPISTKIDPKIAKSRNMLTGQKNNNLRNIKTSADASRARKINDGPVTTNQCQTIDFPCPSDGMNSQQLLKACCETPVINSNGTACGQQMTACPQGRIVMCKNSDGVCVPKLKKSTASTLRGICCGFDPKKDALVIKFADCSRLAEGASVKMTFISNVQPRLDLVPALAKCLPQAIKDNPDYWVSVKFEANLYVHPAMMSAQAACEAMQSGCLPCNPGVINQIFNTVNQSQLGASTLCNQGSCGGGNHRRNLDRSHQFRTPCSMSECDTCYPETMPPACDSLLPILSGVVGRTWAFYPLTKGNCDWFGNDNGFDPACHGKGGFHPLSLNVSFNPGQCSSKNWVKLSIFPHFDTCQGLENGDCSAVNGGNFHDITPGFDDCDPMAGSSTAYQTPSSLTIMPGTLMYEVTSANLTCDGEGAISCRPIVDACTPSIMDCLCELKDSGVINQAQFECLLRQIQNECYLSPDDSFGGGNGHQLLLKSLMAKMIRKAHVADEEEDTLPQDVLQNIVAALQKHSVNL